MVTHIRSLQDLRLDKVWLTIGVFDGLHLGHQTILRRLSDGARKENVPAVVLTFHPHPAVIIGSRQGNILLTTPDERAELMGSMGIDFVITYPFDLQTATTSAEDFITLLKQRLGFTWLGVGKDFALGRGRQGNVEFLKRLSEAYDYRLQVFAPVQLDSLVVSSSYIREKLTGGDVRGAARMLGRPYSLSGEVIHGDGRGRSIGIPTANLAVDEYKLIPASGVYACQAYIGNKPYMASVNIGYRPTFDGSRDQCWVEAHVLDFDDDLYGKRIRLNFVERLRGEQRFTSVAELLQQIYLDIQKTQEIVTV